MQRQTICGGILGNHVRLFYHNFCKIVNKFEERISSPHPEFQFVNARQASLFNAPVAGQQAAATANIAHRRS